MKAIVAACMQSFKTQIAYRAEVWLRVFGSVISVFIQVSIWKAVLGDNTVSGINISDMITYSIIATTITIVLMTDVFRPVDERLKSGNIIMDLVKPISYPILLIANQLGQTMYQFIFTLIPTLFIASWMFGFQLPPTAFDAMTFGAAMILAIVISFCIGYLIALLAIWYLTTFVLEWTVKALITVFSGVFLPIWFFTPGWQSFADMLPFKYLGFVPAALYMGKIPREEVVFQLSAGVGWAGILILTVHVLWRQAIKRLVIQGG